jgi:MoaA/NifB/PqqE/SkfB family radical SAM enzyme
LEKIKKEQVNGDYQTSLRLLESIFNIDEYDIAFEYAKTLYFLKQFDKAIEILLSLNKKNPQNNNIIDILIKSYKESNKTEEIINFINSNTGFNERVLLEMAEMFFSEKRYKNSVKIYEQYINIKSNDINVVSKLLQIYNFLGQKQKAINLANKYLQLDDVKNNVFFYNLFLNEQEIAQEKTVLNSKPRIRLVMLTNKCNLKCPMCATVHQSNHWDISDNFKKYILDNLQNLELITWQGGEVFLYKDFEKIFLEASKNKYLKQIIITNGLLIDEKWANLLSLANHLDLTISIDSIEKKIYEKLRYGAKFEQLLANLNNIKNIRQKNNSNITVTMRTTISDDNIYTLEQIVNFAIRYNINLLILSPLISENNKQYNFADKTHDELLKINDLINTALEKAGKNNIKIINLLEDMSCLLKQKCNVDLNLNNDKKESNTNDSVEIMPLCFRPWKQIATTVDGEIKPECMCVEQVENMHVCQDFNALWNNSIMQEYREKMINFNLQWCCDSCKNNIVSQEHKKFTCW